MKFVGRYNISLDLSFWFDYMGSSPGKCCCLQSPHAVLPSSYPRNQPRESDPSSYNTGELSTVSQDRQCRHFTTYDSTPRCQTPIYPDPIKKSNFLSTLLIFIILLSIFAFIYYHYNREDPPRREFPTVNRLSLYDSQTTAAPGTFHSTISYGVNKLQLLKK